MGTILDRCNNETGKLIKEKTKLATPKKQYINFRRNFTPRFNLIIKRIIPIRPKKLARMDIMRIYKLTLVSASGYANFNINTKPTMTTNKDFRRCLKYRRLSFKIFNLGLNFC